MGSQLLGKQVGGDAKTVQRLIGSGAQIMARGLDKSAEFEADRIGVVLATRAGYDPWGLPSVLQEIGALSKGDAGGVALLFKTHPHPDERLSALGEADGRALRREHCRERVGEVGCGSRTPSLPLETESCPSLLK